MDRPTDIRAAEPLPGIEPPPLAAYVHLPWCVKKCPYCDFNSHALRDRLPETDYRDALLRDLSAELQSVAQRPIETVFFGGGTPSLVSPSVIAAVLDRIAAEGVLATDAEITLEANPGAVDAARFTGYVAAGVNRLSIGAQTLDNRLLRNIGRIHDARQVRTAVAAARNAGFENLNLDLMFALPGQSVADAAADVEAVLQLAPEHVSYYQLTLEPNTLFHARPPQLPDDECAGRMQDYALARLRESGFGRYEVSAFARRGHPCRHNLNYWNFGDYLGVGAGAHGKISDTDGVVRYSKPRSPGEYMACERDFRRGSRNPGGNDIEFEFLLNALRLRDGFSLEMFARRTGGDPDRLLRRLESLVERRLLKQVAGRVRATERGYAFLDDVLASLLPEPASAGDLSPMPV